MFTSIKRIVGTDGKQLRKPIALLVVDTVFSMFFYAMLYFVLTDLIHGVFSFEKIKTYVVIMAVVFVLRSLVAMVAYEMIHTRGSRVTESLRVRLGDHIRTLNLGYFNKNSIGSLTNVLTNDLQDFEQILTHSTGDLIKTVLLTLYLVVVIFFIDSDLGVIQLGILMFTLPLIFLGGHFVSKLGRKKKKVMDDMISRMVEYLAGIKVFKAYNLTGDKFKRLDETFKQFKVECIRTEVAIVPFVLLFQVLVDLSFPVLLWFAIGKYHSGALSKEVLLTYVIVSLALTNVLRAFGPQYGIFRYMRLASEKLVNTLEETPVPYTKTQVTFDHYDIEFEGVHFGYEMGGEVLKGLSFTAKSGEMMALIGPSGSGKTTVTSLIARFWDVNRGCIKVGGHDIRDIEPDRLLDEISMVFQEVYLLNDTVYNNVLMGNPKATKKEVEHVCRLARCHEFICKMEQGYQTVIGEGGFTLSGGEKQRISIARALLKDAPIILLDEATASLDADNEFEIREAIEKLMANKTVVVIAHRLNTIQKAHQIVLIGNGTVEECGTHDALMTARGHYHNLYLEIEKSKNWVL